VYFWSLIKAISNITVRKKSGGAQVNQFAFSNNPNLGILRIPIPKAEIKISTENFGIFVESLNTGTITSTKSEIATRTKNLACLCKVDIISTLAQFRYSKHLYSTVASRWKRLGYGI
jgi:hypothetical protein